MIAFIEVLILLAIVGVVNEPGVCLSGFGLHVSGQNPARSGLPIIST